MGFPHAARAKKQQSDVDQRILLEKLAHISLGLLLRRIVWRVEFQIAIFIAFRYSRRLEQALDSLLIHASAPAHAAGLLDLFPAGAGTMAAHFSWKSSPGIHVRQLSIRNDE